MSIKLLPKSQQAELMAMVSISKVLKSMVDKTSRWMVKQKNQ